MIDFPSYMETSNELLIFFLDGYRYALHLPVVERVFPSVEITPLPKGPEIVLGVVNVQGRIIPVVNIRRRFHLPEREVDPGDQLILAHTSRRPVALLADSVGGVVEWTGKDVVSAESLPPGVRYVEGVVKLEEGMVLIHDIDTFLSLDEEESLGGAMKNMGNKDDL